MRWASMVGLLLRMSSRRARARMRVQARRNRSVSAGSMYAFALFGGLMFQVLVATAFVSLVNTASELDLATDGRIVVSSWLYESMKGLDDALGNGASTEVVATHRRDFSSALSYEAITSERRAGGDAAVLRSQLAARYEAQGSKGFRPRPEAPFGSPGARGLALLSALLACWWLSLVLQGEGVAQEATRRRHPAWEWYLAFPVPQSAVFTAEALSPIVSNPFLLLGPFLLAILVGRHVGSFWVGACALPLGIPLVVAAAVWAKALEVVVMLRTSVRNRAAWFAVMAGGGFVAMFLPVMLLQAPGASRSVIAALAPLLALVPGAGVLIDAGTPAGWLRAMATTTLLGALLALPAFLAMRFATARGLEGGFGTADAAIASASFRAPRSGWLGDPLLHKEWLWLRRDRGALVQLIGAPLLLVGIQFLNLRNMLHGADLSWNKFAGVVVGLGAYMLYVTGPRALLSEGPALALTLSWPRSIEDTLRMKVRLLFAIVTAMVWACLAVLMWMWPADGWKILLVALAWPVFGLSVAEKAVTLIRAPSHSGESEPLSPSQTWVAGLGNLTFAIGLYMGQWSLAMAAIAMNWVFAGALWQGFRQRLMYLFDPDSQPAVRPPTILSSVIASVGVMELGVVLSIPLLLASGEGSLPFARAMGYGVAAALVSLAVWRWHRKQDVSLGDIIFLEGARPSTALACLGGAAAGTLLGMLGLGYQVSLQTLPWPEVRLPIEQSMRFFAEYPGLRQAFGIMAIGIAPWVEEFIFRGLMFRAMIPQWGMTRAVVASSAFFAVLHPPLAWPMVFCLGALNALVFIRTRSLLPCILLHASYNAVIVGLG